MADRRTGWVCQGDTGKGSVSRLVEQEWKWEVRDRPRGLSCICSSAFVTLPGLGEPGMEHMVRAAAPPTLWAGGLSHLLDRSWPTVPLSMLVCLVWGPIFHLCFSCFSSISRDCCCLVQLQSGVCLSFLPCRSIGHHVLKIILNLGFNFILRFKKSPLLFGWGHISKCSSFISKPRILHWFYSPSVYEQK